MHPLYHASNQQQANQATNTPKSYIFLPVHDPSITVCVFSESKQPTSPAGRTNQHTNQRKWDKLDDEWPESIFHHVGSQSASYLLSVQCEVLSRVS